MIRHIVIDQRIEKAVHSLSDYDLHKWMEFYHEWVPHLDSMTAPKGQEEPWKTYKEQEHTIQAALDREFGLRSQIK